jgi:glycosyltransferase involved in cell wall biosynthesis
MSIKISVIIPAYNIAPYLEDCLTGVLEQSFKDYEVIIVNDGSTDDSAEVAQALISGDDRFRIINIPHGGLSAARNTGIANAHGKYIYFLDGDDSIRKDTLQLLYSNAEANDLDVILFSACTFTDSINELKDSGEYRYNGHYEGVYSGSVLSDELVRNNDAHHCSSCMMMTRLDHLKENNLFFNEQLSYSEDSLMFIRLIPLSKRTSILDEPLYMRRYRNGSITTNTDSRTIINDMCTLYLDADAFINSTAGINTSLPVWYLELFITTIMKNHEQLSVKDSLAIRSLQPHTLNMSVKRYKYFHSKRIALFMRSLLLYRLYSLFKNPK